MSENKLSLTDWIPPCIVEGQKQVDHERKIIRWLLVGLLLWIGVSIASILMVILYLVY
jgi:hypothetical protein